MPTGDIRTRSINRSRALGGSTGWERRVKASGCTASIIAIAAIENASNEPTSNTPSTAWPTVMPTYTTTI